MKTYKIIKSTSGIFAGTKFTAETLTCESISIAIGRPIESKHIIKQKEGTYCYCNGNYVLIIKEVN